MAPAGLQRAGVVQLPVPPRDISPRGPQVAPGTFTATLDVDGVTAGSRNFEVRSDPASAVTAAQHKARDAFVVEVMALQEKVERLAGEVRTRRAAATGDEATRLQALEARLGAVGGRGGRGGGRGAAGPAPIRQRLGTLLAPYIISGARTGTVVPPTGTMREMLAEVKADLAAIEKELVR